MSVRNITLEWAQGLLVSLKIQILSQHFVARKNILLHINYMPRQYFLLAPRFAHFLIKTLNF